jgi:hypothetical protein
LITPAYENSVRQVLKSAVALGLSNAVQAFIMSALFYFGGLIMKDSVDPVTGMPSITPTAFFMAVLVIQGGATQAGFALAAGADLGKALNAVSKVFGIIEYPSRINAFEMDEKKIG